MASNEQTAGRTQGSSRSLPDQASQQDQQKPQDQPNRQDRRDQEAANGATRRRLESETKTLDSFRAHGSAGGQFSDEQTIDAECERLLRKTKRQVKQMMEEAVTKKFIHEESSSIISLCVAIDACLSHGLKRRALGLFKTNSSTALINKVAKNCPIAQEVLTLVEIEEKSKLEQQQQLRKQSINQQQIDPEQQNTIKNNQQQFANQAIIASGSCSRSSPIKQASNLQVHKRNMWIKCALIEKKLVEIVEYLAQNANKYYEPEALMSNCLSAQILCSLLVGPCALEFSRSKTNDYYQFEEPSADELLKRHKLSNPIACLCTSQRSTNSFGGIQQHSVSIISTRNDNINQKSNKQAIGDDKQPNRLAISESDCSGSQEGKSNKTKIFSSDSEPHKTSTIHRSRRATVGQTQLSGSASSARAAKAAAISLANDENFGQISTKIDSTNDQQHQRLANQLNRFGSQRRRPLALKTNAKTGALVTDCHHYSCQEISEHQQIKGYSFKCNDFCNGLLPNSSQSLAGNYQSNQINGPNGATQGVNNPQLQHQMMQVNQMQQECWSAWSPRMLHETLHQNSKSNLLYAKNNVLMETQPHQTMAGYLSLHQTSNDLILKWIPNQMINGQASNGGGGGGGGSLSSGLSNEHQNCSCGDQLQHIGRIGSSLGSSCDQLGITSADDDADKSSNRQSSRKQPFKRQAKSGDSIAGKNRHDTQKSQQRTASAHEECLQGSIESAYLDLVVSLSVSRIVLLHCQFGGNVTLNQSQQQQQQQQQSMPLTPNEGPTEADDNSLGLLADESNASNDGEKQLKEANGKLLVGHSDESEETPQAMTNSTAIHGNDNSTRISNESFEETLILVELDGVQRAPFKFPKGGLRWFLSCLEGGLRPHRYLEPAIRPAYDAGLAFDPLAPFDLFSATGASGSNSPSVSSEPANYLSGSSKLDLLLRRLPSLKRRNQVKSDSTPLATGNLADSRTTSPTPSELQQPQQNQQQAYPVRVPCNFVYRIVSTQQQQSDWRLQTPPDSALSVASSSSGSFALIFGGSSALNRSSLSATATTPDELLQRQRSDHQTDQANQQDNYAGGGHRFRWSLSRLTRFSNRYTNTSSASNSSCGGVSSPASGSVATTTTNTSAGVISNGSLQRGSTALESGSLTESNDLVTTLDSVNEDVIGGCETGANIQLSRDASIANCETEKQQQVSGINESLERDEAREFVRIEAKLSDLKKSSSDELMGLRNQSIQTLCKSMRRQIVERAIYGWRAYCRRKKIIRTHLSHLINDNCRLLEIEFAIDNSGAECRLAEMVSFGLTRSKWSELISRASGNNNENLTEDKRKTSGNKQQKEHQLTEAELSHQVSLYVYYGGIESNELRMEVWPYLLGHFNYCDSLETRQMKDRLSREAYEACGREWIQVERVVKQRDNEILAANMARAAERSRTSASKANNTGCSDEELPNASSNNQFESETKTKALKPDRAEEVICVSTNAPPVGSGTLESETKVSSQLEGKTDLKQADQSRPEGPKQTSRARSRRRRTSTTLSETSDDICLQSDSSTNRCPHDEKNGDCCDELNENNKNSGTDFIDKLDEESEAVVEEELNDQKDIRSKGSSGLLGTSANIESHLRHWDQRASDKNEDNHCSINEQSKSQQQTTPTTATKRRLHKGKDTDNLNHQQKANTVKRRKRRVRLESTGSVGSDASITDQFGNNIHRIDKDVQRCDRNFWYFKDVDNLEKLRNIMCSYIWRHLDVGYVQGMCDLAAPFLVIFDDEILAYTCFERLMTRMVANFPHGNAMDKHFDSLKYLMQVLDPKLFKVLQDNGDYTHFYFCYRWLLLDFKRELAYEDVFRVWETIWSARHIATDNFVVFMALAMVRYYRDIIIENNMDFTDTIKFFNEMAERHDTKKIIDLARDSVMELESLMKV